MTARRTRGRLRAAAMGLASCLVAGLAGHAQGTGDVPPSLRIGITQADGSVRVEALGLDDYVARVVSGEGQPRAGAAAQEALAIVVRTFAVANRQRHRAEGYELCDTTHCQVMRPVLPAARDAALATAGQLLLDRGRPAFVFYSANNGGKPALASEVWPGATDYAPAMTHDDACADDAGWSAVIATADLERVLRAAGLAGRHLRSLGVAERTPSDRAGRLRADGFTPAAIPAHEFRMAAGRTLGWQVVRSTAFTVTRVASGYRFDGVGYGHGVGLCVVGAGKRAARGDSASAILHAYFRDLTIGPVAPTSFARTPVPASPPVSTPPAPPVAAVAPPPVPATAAGLRVMLPATDEGDRALVVDMARRAREDVMTRAQVAPPDDIGLTIHPSLDAFGRATSQPWWVTASTVGAAIDVAPLALLRQRGLLESTVRYEIAFAIVSPHLKGAPAWVRVGAALYFSATRPALAAHEERVPCPSDAELLQPVSGGAQREAFSRAERCFRRQVGSHKDWREIR